MTNDKEKNLALSVQSAQALENLFSTYSIADLQSRLVSMLLDAHEQQETSKKDVMNDVFMVNSITQLIGYLYEQKQVKGGQNGIN